MIKRMQFQQPSRTLERAVAALRKPLSSVSSPHRLSVERLIAVKWDVWMEDLADCEISNSGIQIPGIRHRA